MTEAQARQWLADRGRTPLETTLGEGREGRWYPDSPGNRKFFAMPCHCGKNRYGEGEEGRDETHCLLPPDIYYALNFLKPPDWQGTYPWFRPYSAAVDAAVKVLMEQPYETLPGTGGVSD